MNKSYEKVSGDEKLQTTTVHSTTTSVAVPAETMARGSLQKRWHGASQFHEMNGNNGEFNNLTAAFAVSPKTNADEPAVGNRVETTPHATQPDE